MPPVISAEVSRRLQSLERRGLRIPDPEKAVFYIDRIGWFRFGSYFIPFQQALEREPTHIVAFDDVLRLYRFDRRLRLLCLDASERIEMSLKACLFDHLVNNYGKWWFKKKEVFSFNLELQEQIDGHIERHPKRKYHPQAEKEFNPLTIFDLISFGQVSKLFAIIPEEVRCNIAGKFRKYDDDKPLDTSILEAWLKAITHVRNISAHHGRLWNQHFESFLPIPGFMMAQLSYPRAPGSWKQKFYGRAVIMFFLLDRVSRNTTWHCRVNQLMIENLPNLPNSVDLYRHMGFPKNWLEATFWNPQRTMPREEA